MSLHNMLKMEKTAISNFQKELYNGDKKNPNVGTRFSLDLEKRSQSSHIKIKLDSTPKKDGEIVYTASKKYDFLHKLTAHIDLQPIKVKDKWKKKVLICYHHNLGHNILPFGECKIDNEHYGYLDSKYVDFHSQTFYNKKKLYARKIGSIPCLEKWGTELAGLPLSVPQPFTFTRNTRVSLPILKSSKNTITFEYKYKNKLTDLIRMKILNSKGEYEEIKCNLNYLDFKSDHIPLPELWGRYSDITDEERNWRKSVDEDTGEPRKHIVYIEDIACLSSKNPISIGTKDVISLDIKNPTKYIVWMAMLENGNLSNYTTNQEDVYTGWNPCATSGINYGTEPRVEEAPHEHFDEDEFFDWNWPKAPKESGYNVHTYVYNPSEIQNADNAVILKECGASLHVTLNDTDPFMIPEEEQEYYDEDGDPIPIESLKKDANNYKKDKYVIHVINVISRKLEVYWDDKSESLKYVFIDN